MSTKDTKVLAIDCLDFGLVNDWGLTGFQLDHTTELTPYMWHTEYPHTAHIWPYVAMKVEPVKSGKTVSWENPLIDHLSTGLSFLPKRLREYMGSKLEDSGFRTEHLQIQNYDHPHIFDSVFQWPGIRNEHLKRAWDLSQEVAYNKRDLEEAKNIVHNDAMESIDWLISTEGLTATHIHYIDFCSHIEARNEVALKQDYKLIEGLVNTVRENVESLMIISDHGIKAGWIDTPPVGHHSMRGYFSVTSDWPTPIPQNVKQVHDYIRLNKNPENNLNELLNDLGYLS